MSDPHHGPREAKAILGDTGTIRRVAAFAVVYPADGDDGEWVVMAPDCDGGNDVYLSLFAGPHAKERALEYAGEKYAGVEIRVPDPTRPQ